MKRTTLRLPDGAPTPYTLESVIIELATARRKFPEAFNSAHEGFAILREEVDELWEVVRGKQGIRSKKQMRAEAVQVAAMALRLIEDVCDVEGDK